MVLNVEGWGGAWILDVMFILIMLAVGIAKAEKGLYSRLMPVLITGASALLALVFTAFMSNTLIDLLGDWIRRSLIEAMGKSVFDYSNFIKYVNQAPENVVPFLLFCVSMVIFLAVLTIIKNAFNIVIDLPFVSWIDKIGGFVIGVLLVAAIFYFLLYVAAICNVTFIPQLTEGSFLVRLFVKLAYKI